MITKEEVRYIAQLAKIKITQKEEKKFVQEISLILDYFKQLRKIKTEDIQPTTHSIFETKAYKNPKTRLLLDKNQELLKMAPEIKNGYLKVKSVF